MISKNNQRAKWLLLIVPVLVFAGCKKDQKPPTKAVLTSPSDNNICTNGVKVSSTQSAITFTWQPGEFTGIYDVNIKNLLTGITQTRTTSSTTIIDTLLNGTPYSWWIVSKSAKVSATAQSDVWKFYVSAPGVTSYSPFPATIVSPIYAQSLSSVTSVDLSWKGNDVDNDITSYEVYFGTTPSPPLLNGNVTDMFLNGVAVSTNNTYYWKVITKDAMGNKSDSGIYKFMIK